MFEFKYEWNALQRFVGCTVEQENSAHRESGNLQLGRMYV